MGRKVKYIFMRKPNTGTEVKRLINADDIVGSTSFLHEPSKYFIEVRGSVSYTEEYAQFLLPEGLSRESETRLRKALAGEVYRLASCAFCGQRRKCAQLSRVEEGIMLAPQPKSSDSVRGVNFHRYVPTSNEFEPLNATCLQPLS